MGLVVVVVAVVVVSHIQRIDCQPEKNYFTRWPIPLKVDGCQYSMLGWFSILFALWDNCSGHQYYCSGKPT